MSVSFWYSIPSLSYLLTCNGGVRRISQESQGVKLVVRVGMQLGGGLLEVVICAGMQQQRKFGWDLTLFESALEIR